MAHLYFLMKRPEQDDRILIWDTRTLSIGRAPENDLTLEDDEVSRKHVLLTHENGVFEAGDYRTGNGTYINGTRVSQKKSFKPGDTLGIGKLQMEFNESEEHPAKLGLKADYASHLKTMGMMPGMSDDGDANATVLGLGDDSKAFADEFVIEPERGSGEVAFVVGEEGDNQFQMRELDDSLNDMDFDLDGGMAFEEPVEPPPETIPLSLELETTEPPPAAPPAPPAAAPAAAPAAPAAAPAAPAASTAPATTAAGTTASGDSQSGADPTERLRKLKLLHDEGLITEDEFQAKRAQILSEM